MLIWELDSGSPKEKKKSNNNYRELSFSVPQKTQIIQPFKNSQTF